MTRHVPWLFAFVLASASLSAADMAEVQKRGTLRVIALKSEAPEMFRFDSGGEPGFEREMIAGFARMHGLTLEPVQSPTTEARIPLLRRGKADVIIGIVDTKSRRGQIAFTAEVLPAQHLVVTHEPHPVVTTVEGCRKEKIGLVKDSSWAQAAFDAGAPRATTRLFPDRTDVFEGAPDRDHHGHGDDQDRLSAGGAVAPGPRGWRGPRRGQPRELGRAEGGRQAAGRARRLHRQLPGRAVLEPSCRQVLRRSGPARPGARQITSARCVRSPGRHSSSAVAQFKTMVVGRMKSLPSGARVRKRWASGAGR